MRLSKLQKLNSSAIGKCASVFCSTFGNWKMKKWRGFVNTLAPLPMPLRRSFYNGAEHSAWFLQVKNERLPSEFFFAIGN
jgi:hypothetical protein